MKRRQRFITERQYKNTLAYFAEEESYWQNHAMEADSPEQENALKARRIQRSTLAALVIQYTAGEAIDSLRPQLEKVITSYEHYQSTLAAYENIANISPLNIEDYPHQFEEFVQIVSLCILLHRNDLLSRFVRLFDQAGYAGEDTLYEDLLRPCLPERYDVDEWYHAVYTPLIRAIYSETKSEASQLLKQYCNEWYPAFEQAPWHDSHLDGEEGSYFGYWAFEAAAVAFLYGIDDREVDHMVYPRDLVEYAKNYKEQSGGLVGRIESGKPCSRSGYWFTPAQTGSRRYFNQGDIMPCFSGSNWGDTLWYWSGEK
ncbi:PoNe immunity protein domain-containing protein [Pseudomonas chlororaphis]|uniref:PoNe immunity protein domain-containing protein n=1 Tax=Pseudomonas chlororaphis TaxID=587753 RepID=UPI0039E133C9